MPDERNRHLDPLAKIHPSAVIGASTAVWAMATVHDGVVLGSGVSVGEHAYIGRGARVGDGTRIGNYAYIVDHCVVGDRCFIAAHVAMANDRYPRANNPHYKREDIVIEDEVNIGTNATLLPGIRLGHGCTVGAGAVVTRDVKPYDVVVGNPAHSIR